MGFVDFVMLMLKSFDLLAWPLISLAYPIWASIRVIEGNSNDDNRKWLTFWVLFAMTMLFEYISEPLIKWIPFWLEMKLVVTFCLVAPRLNGAVYVYETFIRPCFHVNPQTCSTWFNIPKKTFLLGSSDDFLLVADRYVKENGSEVLDKLIAEKVMCTETNLPQNQIREITAIEENKVMAAQSKVSPGSLVLESTKKEWTCTICSITTSNHEKFKDHFWGKKHREKQEELKAEKMAARNKVNFLSNETGENKATTAKRNAAPGSSVLEKFLKKWSCDICQVKTSSEGNLRDHLGGKKHKEKQEEIKANKMATKNKGISKQNDTEEPILGSKTAVKCTQTNFPLAESRSLPAKMESKVLATECPPCPDSLALATTQREWTCALCQVSTSSEVSLKGHLRGKKHLEKEAEIKANTMAAKRKGGHVSKSKQTDQPIGASKNVGSKKQASLWCHNCNVSCSGPDAMINHLSGKKHLAKLQEGVLGSGLT
ncbi:hypothetical protein GIB67_026000 [Kingdonia uniflora]|uniref:HVA22-like protein n=1 Tax=Kingdonia uniflora TaxID=39325 RepID=A0A7J7M2Y6_9MAGN|nr:hypothetical protein GIB67_026000 [Kingdonia uniflora]